MEKTTDYADFLKEHEEEVLQSAVDAINPDIMGMDRQQALTLAGAMKSCGFTAHDFSNVMSRSSVDKGTFAKQWNKFRGSGQHGEATAATIYDYAKRSGWKWPAPYTEEKAEPFKGKKISQAPMSTLIKPMDNDFKLHCIIDSKAYSDKPANVWEIRNREQIPTPAPIPQAPADFARAITSGHTFYPAVYKKEQDGTDTAGKPIYKYRAISQQVFIVDIDNEEHYIDENHKQQTRAIKEPLTIEAALERCKQNDIAPFLVYETFSSKKHREATENPYYKFRLCFALDKPLMVQEWGERGISKVVNYFIDIFGEAADHKTTDVARLIYGTDEKDSARLFGNVIDSKKLMKAVYASDQKEKDTKTEECAEESAEELKPVGEYIELFKQHRKEIKQNIRTGFTSLDIALGGGFGNELYILGAETGTGKSAIASVLAQNIAASGIDVLYYALEMGRDEFIARGTSAISAEEADGTPIKYGEILNDTYDYTLNEFSRRPYEQYEKYVQEYHRRYGKHLYIIEGGIGGRSAKDISEAVIKFKQDTDTKQLAVFVDYLQLLSADPEDRAQRDLMNIMSAAVKTLKALASQTGATVFLISSMANDRKGQRVNDASFKYSGDIGYTGGVLLGWNWKGVTNVNDEEVRQQTIEESRRTGCRHMLLEVLKNRSGERDKKIELIYKPAYNLITDSEQYGFIQLDETPDIFKILSKGQSQDFDDLLKDCPF